MRMKLIDIKTLSYQINNEYSDTVLKYKSHKINDHSAHIDAVIPDSIMDLNECKVARLKVNDEDVMKDDVSCRFKINDTDKKFNITLIIKDRVSNKTYSIDTYMGKDTSIVEEPPEMHIVENENDNIGKVMPQYQKKLRLSKMNSSSEVAIIDHITSIKKSGFLTKSINYYSMIWLHKINKPSAFTKFVANNLAFILVTILYTNLFYWLWGGSGAISKNIMFIIAFILTYLTSSVVLSIILKVDNEGFKNKMIEYYKSDDASESRHSKQALKTLNTIVELEHDANVAHRLHEFIDLKQSTETQLIVEHSHMGRIKDNVNENRDDNQLTAKQLAIKNYVISEPMALEDIDELQYLIHEYQETKRQIEYQQEYQSYQDAFKENLGKNQDSKMMKSLNELHDDLEKFNQNIDDIKKMRIKDTSQRIDDYKQSQ